MIRTTAFVLLLASVSCLPSGARADSAPQSIPELQSEIEKVLSESRTPGAAIALVTRDKVEWLAGIGQADVAAKRPVTTNTLFRLGSVSKGFVAVAAMQLQEQGKLKLTDTLKQWLPELSFVNPWEATDPVRLVHLMEHTSGFDGMRLREYALNDPTPMALKDALACGASSRVCRWRPGTRMAYCNAGPAIVAAVIEKASGQTFEEYMKEHVFKPLRMDDASYLYTPEVEQRLTRLYRQDGVTPYPYWHIALRPTAALNASAADLANYVRFLLQRGRFEGVQVLQPSSIARIETTETMPSAGLTNFSNYGLYNYSSPENAFVFRGHNGAVFGGIAQIGYLPTQGRGYVILINSGSFKTMFRIASLVRQYVTKDLSPPALPPVVTLSAATRKQYEGYYELISPEAQVFYGFDRLLHVQKLTFTINGLSTSCYGFFHRDWVPVSEQLYRAPEHSLAMLAFLPAADGERLLQYNFTTFKRVPGLEFWAQLLGMGTVSFLVLSSLLFAPVWAIRKWSGKLSAAGPLSVRVWPLVGAASLVLFDLLLASGVRGILTATYIDDASLGVCSVLTVSIMLSSIVFPIAAAAGLWAAWRHRAAPMNRVAYWHSVLVGVALAGTGVYYGYWGLIGLRLWA